LTFVPREETLAVLNLARTRRELHSSSLMSAFADHVFEFLGTYATPRRMRFFADGWGDVELASRVAEKARAAFAPRRARNAVDVEVTWLATDVDEKFAVPVTRSELSFRSPFADALPAESARVVAARWTPTLGAETRPRERRKVAVLLPCTGDQYEWFRRGIAEELLAEGIECVVPTIAYYGCRKPEAQLAHVLRTVSEAKIQSSVTPVEMACLVRGVHEEIKKRDGVDYRGVDWVLAGISLGGTMGALAACALKASGADVGGDVSVCCVAGPSDGTPFVEGSIGKRVAWDVLGSQLGADERATKERMLEEFAELEVGTLAVANSARRAVCLTAKHDRFIVSSEGLDKALRLMSGDGFERIDFDGGHLNFLWKRKAVVVPAIKRAFGIDVVVG